MLVLVKNDPKRFLRGNCVSYIVEYVVAVPSPGAIRSMQHSTKTTRSEFILVIFFKRNSLIQHVVFLSERELSLRRTGSKPKKSDLTSKQRKKSDPHKSQNHRKSFKTQVLEKVDGICSGQVDLIEEEN
jgi:hypothetical protein